MVVLEAVAEPLAALDLAGRELKNLRCLLVRVGKRYVAFCMVRAFLVVVGHELCRHVPKVRFAEDQEMAQALRP